jgi:2-polyprenyl-6-methoxyphenol hydroxylase-like FAD-dependent oxidoreductase
MKIAINGAGVAGPTLAYWLLRGGHEPTLIEKAPALRTGGYVIDFWGLGYTLAERMGILPAVLDAGYQVREVRLVDERGGKNGGFSVRAFRSATGGRFTSLKRSDLAAIIYARLEGRVATLFDDGIVGLEQHAGGVRVRLERGGERDFDLVIGADGLHSAVRELAFGRVAELDLGYCVAAFELADYRPRDELTYVAHATPGRQIARFAMRDDRTLVLLVFRRELLAGAAPIGPLEQRAALRRVFGDAGWEAERMLTALDGADGLYFDRVSQIRMPAWSNGRVALVGDAGAAVSLLAGEGTGLAMAEAYVLAGELARTGESYTAAFAGYENALRGFIESKQKSAAAFAPSFVPRTRLGLFTRRQATKLMTFQLVANLLIGRSIRDDFALPDYDWPADGAAAP